MDATMELILETLGRARRPLLAMEIVTRLPVQIGERCVQKRLRHMEKRGAVTRPFGARSGWMNACPLAA